LKPPRIARKAEREIAAAALWYEDRRVGLGAEFIAELRRTLTEISERPLSFPIDYRSARRALLGRFPYKIYFVLLAADDIVVIAVLHAKQRKDRLRGRL
jgi:toxin ParE1/3/4